VDRIYGAEPCGVRLRLEVAAPYFPSPELGWNLQLRNCSARVLAGEVDGAWQPMSGMILLELPPEVQSLPLQGDVVLVEGGLLPAPEISGEGIFDQAALMRQNGQIRILKAAELSPAGNGRGLLRFAYACRDRLLLRLSASLPPEQAQLCAAVFFGYRGIITGEEKAAYLRAGTFHLFSVSGMHMALLAALLLGLMRVMLLPRRLSWLLLPILLGVYLISTGMPTSALRAWLMISIWALAKARGLPQAGANSAFAAAAIILAWDPRQILDPGFQYSFLLVFSLLAAVRGAARLRAFLAQDQAWLPSPLRRTSLVERLHPVTLTLFTGTASWVSAFALSASLSQVGSFAAIPANLGLALLSWAMFPAAALTLLHIPGGASLLDWLCTSVRQVSEAAAASGGGFATPRPDTWLLALYCLLCLLVCEGFGMRSRWRALAAILLIAAAFVIARPQPLPSVFVFCPRGSQVPAILLNQGGKITLIGCPDSRAAGRLTSRLKSAGHLMIDTLILPDATRDQAGGVDKLLQEIRVARVEILQEKSRSSLALKTLHSQLGDRLGEIRRSSGEFKKDGALISWIHTGDTPVDRKVAGECSDDGWCRIRLRGQNDQESSFFFRRSNSDREAEVP
jgi:ComEC/Rec2-related protein